MTDFELELVGIIQKMVSESGELAGFDAKAWVSMWMHNPLPALGGKLSVEHALTPKGQDDIKTISRRYQDDIKTIIMCIQSGAYC